MPTRIRPQYDSGFMLSQRGRPKSAPRFRTVMCDGCGRWTVFVSLPLGDLRCTTCGSLWSGARTRP